MGLPRSRCELVMHGGPHIELFYLTRYPGKKQLTKETEKLPFLYDTSRVFLL